MKNYSSSIDYIVPTKKIRHILNEVVHKVQYEVPRPLSSQWKGLMDSNYLSEINFVTNS